MTHSDRTTSPSQIAASARRQRQAHPLCHSRRCRHRITRTFFEMKTIKIPTRTELRSALVGGKGTKERIIKSGKRRHVHPIQERRIFAVFVTGDKCGIIVLARGPQLRAWQSEDAALLGSLGIALPRRLHVLSGWYTSRLTSTPSRVTLDSKQGQPRLRGPEELSATCGPRPSIVS